jgi:hypothetical protein
MPIWRKAAEPAAQPISATVSGSSGAVQLIGDHNRVIRNYIQVTVQGGAGQVVVALTPRPGPRSVGPASRAGAAPS